jgi:hypothetical protein
MTSIKTITVVALALLVVSTSLATAAPKQLKPRDTIVPASDSGVVFIPIKVQPDEPKIPYIPLDIDFGDPGQPDIPIIPGVIDVLNKDGKIETRTLLVDCLVKDSAPTTDDLWIVNVGEAELPAGLKIRFSVPSTGDRGAVLLNRSIAAGQKVKATDLLHEARSGAPCSAQII